MKKTNVRLQILEDKLTWELINTKYDWDFTDRVWNGVPKSINSSQRVTEFWGSIEDELL